MNIIEIEKTTEFKILKQKSGLSLRPRRQGIPPPIRPKLHGYYCIVAINKTPRPPSPFLFLPSTSIFRDDPEKCLFFSLQITSLWLKKSFHKF